MSVATDMTWARTPEEKLEHLRNYCEEAQAVRARLADSKLPGLDPAFSRGAAFAYGTVAHHVHTLLEQLEAGV